MSPNAYDLSAGVFVRGLSNLKAQLMKAESQAADSGRDAATLLDARLAQDGELTGAAPYDLHTYSLAAHVHWAAEGARMAIAMVLGAKAVPAPGEGRSFAELYQHIDVTIAALRELPASELEAGLGRPVVVEHRRGSVSAEGGRFLLAFAIPHFYYHATTAYGILRSHGVQLTMGDFLGDWGAA